MSADAIAIQLAFESQGSTLTNVIDNVESGKYAFTGGKQKFAEWKKRVLQSNCTGERQALLIEADHLMYATKEAPPKTESKPIIKKWKIFGK